MGLAPLPFAGPDLCQELFGKVYETLRTRCREFENASYSMQGSNIDPDLHVVAQMVFAYIFIYICLECFGVKR